ncbi:hypothetical protein EJB05_47964, partial [Eragrostis curvula]
MDEEELLKKVRALEEGQAELRRQVSKLRPPERRRTLRQPICSSSRRRLRPTLSHRHHLMVLNCLGQAVHVLDPQGKVLYWNRCAELLYGYPASEAIGQNVTKLLVHHSDIVAASSIIGDIFTGKRWRGKFPVKNKSGERFSIVTDGTPLYDEDGTLIGLICLSEDTRTLEAILTLQPKEDYNANKYYVIV